jgi:hypothetical protein
VQHGSTRAVLATVQHGSTRATVQHGSTRATVQHGATRATVQHGATRATVQHGATRKALACVALVICVAGRAQAQQRPLVTEDPETIGSGLVLVEGGFDQQRKVFYPLSGLTGDLLRVPTLGLSLGVSSIAEIQIDWSPYQRLSVTEREPAPLAAMLDFTGDKTTDIDDIVIGTKVRLVPEGAGHPAFGVRFATKLPNASNESGLGTDTMDFYVSGLVGKTIESIRVVGNVGLGLLGDPIRGDQQNDVLTYGLSLARALKQGLEVVGEINGRKSLHPAEEVPVGTENRSTVRVGARYTVATVRVDGGVIIGLTSRDPNFGFTAGVTWVFRAFTIP